MRSVHFYKVPFLYGIDFESNMVYNIFSLLASCPVWEILFNNIMPCGAADKEINVNINHAFVSHLI